MRILFVRVGWMKFYSGAQPGDERPVGGGSYNKRHKGGEIFNFKNYKSWLYGSFALVMSATYVNLSRIKPGYEGNSLSDVLIVFFSQHYDKKSGQVVIGWYNKSIISSDWGKINVNGIERWYRAKAKIKDSVLLPSYNRTIKIPRGKNTPGQSNTFYIYNSDGSLKKNKWLQNVLSFVNNYDGPNLLTTPESEAYEQIENNLLEELEISGTQGKLLDSAARKVIENRAMNAAIKYYKLKGYSVENVSAKKSYDLYCTKKYKKYYVEVKGSLLTIDRIILTPNEVEYAVKNNKSMKLFILHNIKLTKNKRKYRATGGTNMIYDHWKIDKKKLNPVQ